MGNPARIQELAIGIGYRKQTGTGLKTQTKTQLQTALSAASLWSLRMNAYNVPFPTLNQEDDSEFFNKGHEWVTQNFPTSIDAPWEFPFHLTSQNAAQVCVFAVPKVTKSSPGSGAYQYVCTPYDPKEDGVNLPATTIVGGLRQQGAGSEILDVANVGAVCAGFTIRIQRGPGLQNTQITSRWMGCGRFINGSNIVIPAAVVEHRLGSGASTALLINGVDYLAAASIVDIELTFENNPGGESSYFPGSGQQDGFDLRGRMRYGKRTISLNWAAELDEDSDELARLLAQTEGETDLTIEGEEITSGVNHMFNFNAPRTVHKSLEHQDADGFASVRMGTSIMKGSGDPFSFTIITDQDNIGVAE